MHNIYNVQQIKSGHGIQSDEHSVQGFLARGAIIGEECGSVMVHSWDTAMPGSTTDLQGVYPSRAPSSYYLKILIEWVRVMTRDDDLKCLHNMMMS